MANHLVEIEVTQEMLDKGNRNECMLCPVAEALVEAGICKFAFVDYLALALIQHPEDIFVSDAANAVDIETSNVRKIAIWFENEKLTRSVVLNRFVGRISRRNPMYILSKSLAHEIIKYDFLRVYVDNLGVRRCSIDEDIKPYTFVLNKYNLKAYIKGEPYAK